LTLLLLALLGCARAEQPQAAANPPETPRQAQAGCNAEASRDWAAAGSQYYVIEAEASGPTCGAAVATIRIASRDGDVLFARDYPVAAAPTAFEANSGQTALRTDIEAWISNTAETPTADWLPAWPAGRERPPNFQPAVNRARYEAARGAQGPLFCYPDGADSNACVALAGNSATLLGSLTPDRD
jgi:hypothetical protein